MLRGIDVECLHAKYIFFVYLYSCYFSCLYICSFMLD